MYHPTLSSPVTRRIWGSPDAILLFFAGGAAEFAAIKAVDWLFFTGRLPGAPVERFFETVRFAQSVFFGDPAGATDAIERINLIHRNVEEARGEEIPQWAYRDMLFILIDYGERAHEIVFGPMTEAERASHFGVALTLGRAMRLSGLPTTYAEYRDQRHQQLSRTSSTRATARLLARCAIAFCGWCKPACYRRSSEMFFGSSRLLRSKSSCGAIASCPAAATSCAPYTAPCYRAGSPDSCAIWNVRQTPDCDFEFVASSGPCRGGTGGGGSRYGLVASGSAAERAEGERSADRVCRPPAQSHAQGYPRAREQMGRGRPRHRGRTHRQRDRLERR
jgi:hypothetical protein